MFELDGRAFRFQAQVAAGRFRVGAARDLFAVDPEPDLAVDGTDVVVIPVITVQDQVLGRKAASTVGRKGREGGVIWPGYQRRFICG